MFSGFMGTMVSGMAFGAGSEVAHQAVRSVMGTSHSPQVIFFHFYSFLFMFLFLCSVVIVTTSLRTVENVGIEVCQ